MVLWRSFGRLFGKTLGNGHWMHTHHNCHIHANVFPLPLAGHFHCWPCHYRPRPGYCTHCRPDIHWRVGSTWNTREDHVFLATFLQRGVVHRLLDQLCLHKTCGQPRGGKSTTQKSYPDPVDLWIGDIVLWRTIIEILDVDHWEIFWSLNLIIEKSSNYWEDLQLLRIILIVKNIFNYQEHLWISKRLSITQKALNHWENMILSLMNKPTSNVFQRQN